MHSYLQPIAQALYEKANEERARGAAAYMKNQFAFLGIPMTERRKLCKAYLKQYPLPHYEDVAVIVIELWQLPEREFQYFAIELLAYYKKIWPVEVIHIMEYCLTHKSWWDTVDFLATQGTGPYFKLYPSQIEITRQWNQSNNFWLQRSSLLFQLKYKTDTDTGLLSSYIKHLVGSKAFFIRKAIGWVLREYAKTNQAWVKQFVASHHLSPLSKREALKHIG